MIGLVVLALITGTVFYVANRSSSSNGCDTIGVRPKTCVPANNRCTPPGDSREATVDCAEFRYYEAK